MTDLREKVARAIAGAEIAYFGPKSSLEQCMNWAHEPDCYRQAADAAIALVIEEAARVADATTAYDDNLQKSAGCGTTGQRIAAAVRALGKPTVQTPATGAPPGEGVAEDQADSASRMENPASPGGLPSQAWPGHPLPKDKP